MSTIRPSQNNSKPYSCSSCNKTYKFESGLNRHQQKCQQQQQQTTTNHDDTMISSITKNNQEIQEQIDLLKKCIQNQTSTTTTTTTNTTTTTVNNTIFKINFIFKKDSKDYIDTISLSMDQLNSMDRTDIANMLFQHFIQLGIIKEGDNDTLYIDKDDDNDNL
jgi:hypothetical protein